MVEWVDITQSQSIRLKSVIFKSVLYQPVTKINFQSKAFSITAPTVCNSVSGYKNFRYHHYFKGTSENRTFLCCMWCGLTFLLPLAPPIPTLDIINVFDIVVVVALQSVWECWCRDNVSAGSWQTSSQQQLVSNTHCIVLGQFSLPSLPGRQIEYHPVWLGLRRGVFTCVGWKVTLWSNMASDTS